MDEQELEKQFEATDYDEDGNIKQTPPPPVAAKKKRVTTADLKKDLSDLESYVENEILAWCDQLGVRIDTLEKGIAILQQDNTAIPAQRLDNQDEAIGALANALRQHLEEAAAAPPEPKPELVFAPPPVIPEPVTATKGDIEAVASVCQSMTDVLMICRALKAVQDLPDDDRLYILQVACRMAGVQITSGLQIRAGIKYVEA